MHSTVTSRGQTVVPAALRHRYGIKPGTRLAWMDTGAGIAVVPLPRDIIKALRGHAKGEGLTAALLKERARDRERE